MATYHVTTTGSDSADGSLATPWLTPQKAADTMVAGDTTYVHAGTYTSFTNFYDNCWFDGKTGTAGSPITLAAYSTGGVYDTVIFDGGSTVPDAGRNWGIRISTCAYIIIDGITSYRHAKAGITVGRGNADGTDVINDFSTNITIRNCISYGNGAANTAHAGYEVVAPSHDVLFEYCEAYDNGRGFFWGESHQTNPALLPYNITAQYCYAHDNVKWANNSDGFTTAGVHDVLLSHCVAEGNTADGFTEQGPYADNNIWEYCVAFNGNPDDVVDGEGNGFKIGNINDINRDLGYVGSRNHIVRNCIAFDNRGRGYNDTNGAASTGFYNCVAYRNGGWGWLTESRGIWYSQFVSPPVATTGLVGCTIKNCIGHANANGTYPGTPSEAAAQYNGVYGDCILAGRFVGHAKTHPVNPVPADPDDWGSPVYSSDYNYWSDLGGDANFIATKMTDYLAQGDITEPNSGPTTGLAGDPLFVSANPTCDVAIFTDYATRTINPNFGVVAGLVLQAGSPCIDEGVDVGQGYAASGAAYDIGWDEYVAVGGGGRFLRGRSGLTGGMEG